MSAAQQPQPQAKQQPDQASGDNKQQAPPKDSLQLERPASACCSSGSTGSSENNNNSNQLHHHHCQLHKKPAGATGRKGSLNIVRPPSAEPAASSAGSDLVATGGAPQPAQGVQRKASVHLQASSSNSASGPQRAQLKSTHSVSVSGVGPGASSAGASPAPSPAPASSGATFVADSGAAAAAAEPAALAALVERQNVSDLERELESLRLRLDRGGVKMSKVNQSYLSYFNQWAEYDPFIAQPIPSNPWQSDSTELWDSERQTKDVHCRRVRRWAFSLKELLSDPAGREQFHRFLEKEFSAENLK